MTATPTSPGPSTTSGVQSAPTSCAPRSALRNANACAERWVGTARRECRDHLLIVAPRHLHRVLSEFVEHHNRHRPHRALGLMPPQPRPKCPESASAALDQIVQHDVPGGLIHEYDLAA
ncbi:MAG: transposase [Actinomycetota bacterium]|nr:transposase [Actinomycetota bacterium]